jgi:hypothetical protein
MAKIAEYVAPKTELHPSEAGYSAFETAGRRLGGMYREAANDQITAAKLAGQMAASDIEFPYLLQSLQPASGISIKSVGGSGSGGKDALGFKNQTFPDLAAENAAAQNALGESGAATPADLAARRPLQALAGAVGKLISVPGAAGANPPGGDYGGGSDGGAVSSGGDYGGGSDYVSPLADPFGGAYSGGPSSDNTIGGGTGIDFTQGGFNG